jgi:hypothetical protein
MKIRSLFIQHTDGSWEARQPVTITGAGGAQIVINPGVRFQPGVTFNGIDVGGLCNRDADV